MNPHCRRREKSLLLRSEGRLSRQRSPRKHQLVTRQTKCFVPCACEAGNQLLDRAPPNRDTGVHDLSPRVDARALQPTLFKSHPLRHGYPNRMVDPADFLSWNACGNYVVDQRVDRPEEFNLHAASGLPGKAIAPADLAIDVCEAVP